MAWETSNLDSIGSHMETGGTEMTGMTVVMAMDAGQTTEMVVQADIKTETGGTNGKAAARPV